MEGGIYCNYCGKKMVKPVCQCGHVYCYIRYNHNGERHFRRKLPNGKSLTYDAAKDILASISVDKRKSHKKFKPEEHTDRRAQELLFKAQMQHWLYELKAKKEAGEMKPSYYNRIRSYDRVHFTRLYSLPMQDIGRREIADFKRSLDHLKIKTRKNIMSALHMFFVWFAEQAEENDLIYDYTIPVFPQIKGKNARITFALSRSAQIAHLSEIPERHRDIFEFAMLVGCRRGEVTAYQVGDVRLEDETILTARAWSDNEISLPKNGEPSVKVLFGRAKDIVRKHMEGKLGSDWLFINPDTNNHYLPKRIDELWGLTTSSVKFHEATRHSFITQLLEQGIPAKWVSVLASHKDLQSMKPYDHVQIKNIKAMVYDIQGHARVMHEKKEDNS